MKKNKSKAKSHPSNENTPIVQNADHRCITPKCEELAIVKPDFTKNEIIWAKIRGSHHWPAKIDRIYTTPRGLIMLEIIWYNDYRRSKIHKTQAYKFLENFESFAVKFDDIM